MKKYPKALADVAVLKEVLDYIYRQAESAEDQAASYAEQLKNEDECTAWTPEYLAEYTAKAEAFVRLAERLAK